MSQARRRQVSARPRIGLALGSGGARGWAHIGVLQALARAGVRPDVIAGTSVGALVGGVYASGHLDSLASWARDLTAARMFTYLDPRMSGGGLIGGRRMASFMKRYFADTRVEDLPIPFVAIATDLLTGHEVWMREGPLVDVLRIAISLPGIFTPVKQDGHWLIDGALVNPVPVSVCRALGAQIVIAVNLNADQLGKARMLANSVRAAGFDPASEISAVDRRALRGRTGALWQQALQRRRGAPSLFGVLVSAFTITQERTTRSRLAGDPPDLTVAPQLGHVGLLEFERAAEIIAEGEAAAERVMGELRAALELLG